MIITDDHAALANEIRQRLQARTKTIGDAEVVALLVTWTFLMDHARAQRIDLEQLASEQFRSFVTYALRNISLARPN